MISPIHESEFETRILHDPEIRSWRTVQDSNPRLRLRKPEGYPDYPNSPVIRRQPFRFQCDGWQTTSKRARLR